MKQGGAWRRVVVVELIYVALATLGWWAVDPVRQTFLLPALFSTVARGALILGVPVAGLLAWRYPELGPPSAPGEPRA